MEIKLAEQMIAEWASAKAAALGISPNGVQASYIYNPGGFGNLSFRLTDGRTRLHVKLDDVIDVLADYVEAQQVPEHREAAQRKAKAVHLRAYPQYIAKLPSLLQ